MVVKAIMTAGTGALILAKGLVISPTSALSSVQKADTVKVANRVWYYENSCDHPGFLKGYWGHPPLKWIRGTHLEDHSGRVESQE